MAGHSQFKNIMHRKGAQDAKRAKKFAKLIRELTVATRSGLSDPDANPRLRSAIVAARDANMPKDTIERAIKKASGNGEGDDYIEMRYEGYGPSGVAIIVEALTDNRNRTASEVRSIFTKGGGSLGETNSVSFMFTHVGVIIYPASVASEDEMLEAALEAGAENIVSNDEQHEIICPVDSFFAVKDALESKFGEAKRAFLDWRPQNTVALDAEKAEKFLKMMDALEENDDVQHVYDNADIDESILEELSS